MNHSTDISKIALALVKAQAAMPAVGKEGNNPAFRSKYMTLDGILSVAVPVLTANGMALVQGSEVVAKDDNDRPVSITVESRLIHESGEWRRTWHRNRKLDRQRNHRGRSSFEDSTSRNR